VAKATLPPKPATVFIIPRMAGNAGGRIAQINRACWQMAALAFKPDMRPREVKVGLAVVVKQPKRPAIGVVAGFAYRPEAAKMRVVGYVARHTFQLDFGKIIADMAALASHQKVQPDQRKPRQIMIKRDIIAPARGAVASFALGAKRAIMRVIGLMAANTGGRGLVLKNIDRMAPIAAGLLVLSGQGKIGILLMIKPNSAPRSANMAALAARAKAILVHVLNSVAADASARQFLINLARVAGGARHRCVAVLQRKTRLRMVKIPNLHPVAGGMAISTFAAQSTVMRLAILMATHTL
jgi:hypothetical protein